MQPTQRMEEIPRTRWEKEGHGYLGTLSGVLICRAFSWRRPPPPTDLEFTALAAALLVLKDVP